MANNRFSITSFILLPLAFLATTTTTAAANEIATYDDQAPNIVVEGKVYCQGCKYFGSWSFNGDEPIWRAKVSVICKNHRGRVSYIKSFQTDHDGYFLAQLRGYRMSDQILDHPLQACRVKLASSPLETCNLPTNVNNGTRGATLRFENKRSYDTVIYAAGPLYFRSSDCGIWKTTP